MEQFWAYVLSILVVVLPASCFDINVGAMLNMSTYQGMQSKVAMELAVEDINKDPSVLNGSLLKLHVAEIGTNGTLEDVQNVLGLFKRDVVSVTAPFSQSMSMFLSAVCDEAEAPLISFSGYETSSLLMKSKLSLTMAGNDSNQMTAIASLLYKNYWREVVVIYQDDENGLHGLLALNNALQKTSSRIVERFPLTESFTYSTFKGIMRKLDTRKTQSRVFIVHTSYELARKLFLEVKKENFLNRTGHVWIVTEWAMSSLNVEDGELMRAMNGVVGIRRRTSVSQRTQLVLEKWKDIFVKMYPTSSQLIEMGVTAQYAYDSVWIVSKAMNSLLKDNITALEFESTKALHTDINVFVSGKTMFQKMLETKFEGIHSNINSGRNKLLDDRHYEFLNIAESKIKKIASWNTTKKNEVFVLGDIIWPNGSLITPSGYRKLIVGVPPGVVFNNFLKISENGTVTGFCKDVFTRCASSLPYHLDYEFQPSQEGSENPDYGHLVDQIKKQEFDVIVADITILSRRTAKADFTQPYTDTGLAIMVPVQVQSVKKLWAFLEPFTLKMWMTALAFVLMTAFVVWLLERGHGGAFVGPSVRQIEISLWFAFSTIVFAQREKIITTLGRLVLVMWLFVVLILNSSYTASLTSILTVQQLSPAIYDIETLRASNATIGHLSGSFVKDYLQSELQIDSKRLRALTSENEYVDLLSNGTLGAIVDETPYLTMLMSKHCGKFRLVGPKFYRGGFGFVFSKGSPIVEDMNNAVLEMTQNRSELQSLRRRWSLESQNCHYDSQGENSGGGDNDHLGPNMFGGLFIIVGGVYVLLIAGHYLSRYYKPLVRNFRSSSTRVASVETPSSITAPTPWPAPSIQLQPTTTTTAN